MFGRRCCGVPVEGNAITEPLPKFAPEVVAQGAYPVHRREITRQLASLAETDRQQRALGSSAPPALVSGPVNERLQLDATAYEQRADTLGRVKLVSGDREQIDAEPVHVSRNLADRLSGVGMEEHAMFAGDARALLNRLDGAHLVVGVHDADEDRARRDGPA